MYSDKHPQKIKDLLGYQALIVEARMEYDGETWLAYDRRFRQTVAATPDTMWAKIDPTLWNKAFTGQAKSKRCKYCFSLSHESTDCDWAPTKASASTSPLPLPTSPNHTCVLALDPHKYVMHGTTTPSRHARFQNPGTNIYASIVCETPRQPTKRTKLSIAPDVVLHSVLARDISIHTSDTSHITNITKGRFSVTE